MEIEGVKQLFRLITSEQSRNYRSQSKISAWALDSGVAGWSKKFIWDL